MKDGSIWIPEAPDGYTALGGVAQRGYSTPNLSNYRCVRCRKDALEYLNSYKSIESSEDFKMYLFHFHMYVNRKLSKTYYDINNLTNYEKTNIQNIINKFIIRYKPNKSIELFLTSHFDWFN